MCWREPYQSGAVVSSDGMSYELLIYEDLGAMVRGVEGPKIPYVGLEDSLGPSRV